MNVTLQDLLDSGVHFGHQLRRYNPKSKRFVFDNRHGISIIDLEKTYAQLEKAVAFAESIVSSGKDILFVGTKRQAQEIIREAATACNMPFAASRWMGGTLTNWATIKNSIAKYKRYLKMESEGTLASMPKKEVAAIRREMSRMSRNFEGIVEMAEPPAALFVVDTKAEYIAVAEATRLKIPVIGLVDTNSDPTAVAHAIPGNDDSTKSVRIIVEVIMEAVQNGVVQRESRQAKKTVTPILREDTKEEQLPVIAPAHGAPIVDGEVPTSFSTDDDTLGGTES